MESLQVFLPSLGEHYAMGEPLRLMVRVAKIYVNGSVESPVFHCKIRQCRPTMWEMGMDCIWGPIAG